MRFFQRLALTGLNIETGNRKVGFVPTTKINRLFSITKLASEFVDSQESLTVL